MRGSACQELSGLKPKRPELSVREGIHSEASGGVGKCEGMQ